MSEARPLLHRIINSSRPVPVFFSSSVLERGLPRRMSRILMQCLAQTGPIHYQSLNMDLPVGGRYDHSLVTILPGPGVTRNQTQWISPSPHPAPFQPNILQRVNHVLNLGLSSRAAPGYSKQNCPVLVFRIRVILE